MILHYEFDQFLIMKNIFTNKNINVIGLLFAITTMTLLLACHNHDHSDPNHSHDDHGHAHDTHAHDDHDDHTGHDDHDDHGDEKTVTLNKAQYLNAEIDTGWFSMKNLSDVVNVSGYTELNPQNKAAVSMPLNGMIKTIQVIEGQYVKQGQTIATMQSLEYNNMLLEKAKLNEELILSNATLPFLQQEYDRQVQLDKDGATSIQNLQKSNADLQIERAKVESVKSQMAILDQTIGMFNASGNELPVIAPISGYITHVDINIGSAVQTNMTLFSIINNNKMHVDLLVYENDLAKIEVGQRVRFNLSDRPGVEVGGKIFNIGKSFENNTKSVAVHADIDKGNKNLIPGMYVNALIDIGTNKVQTLPVDAVVEAEGRHFIFLWSKKNLEHDAHDGHDHEEHDEESIFSRLEVKTGVAQLGFIEITLLGKIEKGDRIVTSGAYYLQSHLQKSEGAGGHGHAH